MSKSRVMTKAMIVAGTRALAKLSPALKNPDLALLPDFEDAREANYEVAVAVAEQAIKDGYASVVWGISEAREKVRERMWEAVYDEFVYDPEGET